MSDLMFSDSPVGLLHPNRPLLVKLRIDVDDPDHGISIGGDAPTPQDADVAEFARLLEQKLLEGAGPNWEGPLPITVLREHGGRNPEVHLLVDCPPWISANQVFLAMQRPMYVTIYTGMEVSWEWLDIATLYKSDVQSRLSEGEIHIQALELPS